MFFEPYRRGQGLSASAGSYIGDQIAAAEKNGGISAAAETRVRLLKTDHLNDQLAGLAWLREQSFVQANRIAVAGNSFGGIEVILLRNAELIAQPSIGPEAPKAGRSPRPSSVRSPR